jgi:RNA polymerase sigma-70 factor (ECF subfamily)
MVLLTGPFAVSVPTRPPTHRSANHGRATADAERAPGDHTLLRCARAGDGEAAAALYRRYADRVRALVASRLGGRLAPRVSPDDIAQSVFRVFFRGVVVRAYDVPPGEELWGLLAVLTRRKVRERVAYHQAARRDIRRTALRGTDGLAAEPDADGDADHLRVELDELLEAFHLPDREVVSLRLGGYDVAEIAEQTGRSLRTVERVLQKARTRLRDGLA